ncbi:hypothetical protein L1887_19833 [Cichorium endivia]|nr:hypothetical protein L1887_19833 [Cichorium endivia]
MDWGTGAKPIEYMSGLGPRVAQPWIGAQGHANLMVAQPWIWALSHVNLICKRVGTKGRATMDWGTEPRQSNMYGLGPRVAQPWIGALGPANLIDSGKRLCLLSSIRIVLLQASTLRVCSWSSCDLVVFIRPFNTTFVEIASGGVAVMTLLVGARQRLLAGIREWLLARAEQRLLLEFGLLMSLLENTLSLSDRHGFSSTFKIDIILLRNVVSALPLPLFWKSRCWLELGNAYRLDLDHGAAIWNWQWSYWLTLELGSELAGPGSRLRARARQWLSAGSGERGCLLELDSMEQRDYVCVAFYVFVPRSFAHLSDKQVVQGLLSGSSSGHFSE